MISTFLLSLALGVPAQPVGRAVEAQGDDPAIRVWLNEDGRFQRGDRAKVYVRSRDDGYLVVLHLDPDNRLRVVFPLDPDDDNFVRGGKKYQILGRGERETFEVDVRSGRGTLYAAVSRDPYRWDRFVVGDHWDFAALNDVPLSRDIEADLNEFVRGIATADFDYDFVDYDVYERIYASGTTHYASIHYSPSYSYGDPYYSSWCRGYWRCGGSGLFIGIGIGDPWWYSPYGHYGYYPAGYYPYYPYYYPYRRYPAYYPYQPFYPYRYHDPYRYRGAGTYYAGGYYFGGHYAAPWRTRADERFYSTGFAWRGRGATTDFAQAGRFSGSPNTGFRGRGFDHGDATGSRPAGVTPRRRGAETPAPNMTPVRTEGRRPAATVPNPVRVGAGAEGREGGRVEGRRSGEVRDRTPAQPRQREFLDRESDDRRRGYETGVIEARPEPRARGPEGRGPSRERSAAEDRGQVRGGGEREVRPEPRREAEPRERPQYEPRPAARAEPRREPRAEPRSEPRAEPRRGSPPPRMDAPRAEPRSAPRGHGGFSRGRPRGKS